MAEAPRFLMQPPGTVVPSPPTTWARLYWKGVGWAGILTG